jgi:tRNA threonylcarbamoyladenosine biosynthesis protein TsaE
MTALPYQATIHIASLEALSRFAQALAPFLGPSDVVTLDGTLGTGKTTFSQRLGQALGLQEPITSPTFVLMHEYRTGPFPVVHADLYRLGPEQAHSLEEELSWVIDSGKALLLVEWATYGDFLAPLTTVSLSIERLESPHDDLLDERALLAEPPRLISLAANRPLPPSLQGNVTF